MVGIKLVTPAKVLGTLLIISWIAGGFMLNQTHRQYRQLLQFQKDGYTRIHEQFQQESKEREDSLTRRISDLVIREQASVRAIDSLERVKTKIPKMFVDKTDAELARLMEENASRR